MLHRLGVDYALSSAVPVHDICPPKDYTTYTKLAHKYTMFLNEQLDKDRDQAPFLKDLADLVDDPAKELGIPQGEHPFHRQYLLSVSVLLTSQMLSSSILCICEG